MQVIDRLHKNMSSIFVCLFLNIKTVLDFVVFGSKFTGSRHIYAIGHSRHFFTQDTTNIKDHKRIFELCNT